MLRSISLMCLIILKIYQMTHLDYDVCSRTIRTEYFSWKNKIHVCVWISERVNIFPSTENISQLKNEGIPSAVFGYFIKSCPFQFWEQPITKRTHIRRVWSLMYLRGVIFGQSTVNFMWGKWWWVVTTFK